MAFVDCTDHPKAPAAAGPMWLIDPVIEVIRPLPPLAAGGFFSTGRVSAVLFPAFLWLASVVPARQRPAWTGSFMAVQALNAAPTVGQTVPVKVSQLLGSPDSSTRTGVSGR